jgi:hypothetical protein
MKITNKDLNVFDSLVRSIYLSMPAGIRLQGESKPMTEHQRVALAQIEAAASIYLKAGFIRREDVDALSVTLETPNSDPDTEP